MTTTPDYVPWSVFEWFIGIYGSIVAIFLGIVGWMFRNHLHEDDRRFDVQERRLQMQDDRNERKHSENIAQMEHVRTDVLDGQADLGDRLTAIRRTLDDVLLRWRGRGRDDL